MDQELTNTRSTDAVLDTLINFTKKLYSMDKVKKLDEAADYKQKIMLLQEIIFDSKETENISEQEPEYLLTRLKDKLSDVAAKRYIEESIKREVIKKMQQKEKEYLEEMKLQIINKHTGVENASTLKKLAILEKKKRVKLSKPILDVLRPRAQNEVIGQENALKALISKIASPFPQHVILYGPPGVGKTTAARIALDIAKAEKFTPFNRDAKFVEVDGTTLRWDPRESINPLIGSVHDPIFQGAKRDLAEIGIPEPKPGLVTEAHGGVLFIDEIGELDSMLQNKLLKVLEDKKVRFDSSYYDVDSENIPQYIKMLFEEGAPADFVLIGATTRLPEEINPALRSRCAEIFFNPLNSSHIVEIIKSSAQRLGAYITDEAAELIGNYTIEGRKAVNIFADCCSNAIYKFQSRENIVIDVDCVKEVIGLSRLKPINIIKSSNSKEIGKVNGLGVNGFLGSIIEFEAVAFLRQDEKGSIRFNETAGTMTKDSLLNALSVVRRLSDKNIDRYDVHVNCIGGGKIDGPSAGAAITCLIYSCIMELPIRQDTCITGEISIRGRIKPVGGITEKIHAAKRAGFKNVIIPEDNKNEAVGLEGINIIYAGNIEEVIEFMFK